MHEVSAQPASTPTPHPTHSACFLAVQRCSHRRAGHGTCTHTRGRGGGGRGRAHQQRVRGGGRAGSALRLRQRITRFVAQLIAASDCLSKRRGLGVGQRCGVVIGVGVGVRVVGGVSGGLSVRRGGGRGQV